MELNEALKGKLEHLYRYFSELESVVVCYSGGTNSSLLLYLAQKILGDNAEAVFFKSPVIPFYLQQEAAETAKLFNAKLTIFSMPPLDSYMFMGNPENRCHLCKNEIVTKASSIAKRFNINNVVEGSTGEAPGIHCQNKIALTGTHVRCPFEELKITKPGIREISKSLALPTWKKSPFFCLMTHFRHGTRINEKMLLTVELAENFLKSHGFQYYKIWHDGETARLALGATETVATIGKLRTSIANYLKSLGFKSAYVVDYRMPDELSQIVLY